jgi:hypothetical protein
MENEKIEHPDEKIDVVISVLTLKIESNDRKNKENE